MTPIKTLTNIPVTLVGMVRSMSPELLERIMFSLTSSLKVSCDSNTNVTNIEAIRVLFDDPSTRTHPAVVKYASDLKTAHDIINLRQQEDFLSSTIEILQKQDQGNQIPLTKLLFSIGFIIRGMTTGTIFFNPEYEEKFKHTDAYHRAMELIRYYVGQIPEGGLEDMDGVEKNENTLMFLHNNGLFELSDGVMSKLVHYRLNI